VPRSGRSRQAVIDEHPDKQVDPDAEQGEHDPEDDPKRLHQTSTHSPAGWIRSYWVEEELTFVGEVGDDGWITRHVEVGGGWPSLAGWLVVAWVSDGEAARLHIRTNRRTVVMPMVLRIVIDTVTSGSAAKG
jgi:hypothetical protein